MQAIRRVGDEHPGFRLAAYSLAGLLGRDYVIPDDIKAIAEPAIAHRLIMRTAATIRDVEQGTIVRELLESVPIEAATTGHERPGVRPA